MSKDSKSEIPWSPRLAHELRTLQFAREFVDSIKRVKCDQQEHKERALEIAQRFVDSLPRLADCLEKRQQNQAGRINGRDRHPHECPGRLISARQAGHSTSATSALARSYARCAHGHCPRRSGGISGRNPPKPRVYESWREAAGTSGNARTIFMVSMLTVMTRRSKSSG